MSSVKSYYEIIHMQICVVRYIEIFTGLTLIPLQSSQYPSKFRFHVDFMQPGEKNRKKLNQGLYASCTVYKNDAQRSYRLLATLAGYQVVSLTLIITARRSPRKRFGLNVSCQTRRELTVAATQRWLTLVCKIFATSRATRAVQLAYSGHHEVTISTFDSIYVVNSLQRLLFSVPEVSFTETSIFIFSYESFHNELKHFPVENP